MDDVPCQFPVPHVTGAHKLKPTAVEAGTWSMAASQRLCQISSLWCTVEAAVCLACPATPGLKKCCDSHQALILGVRVSAAA
jgi:hypothetical protein